MQNLAMISEVVFKVLIADLTIAIALSVMFCA